MISSVDMTYSSAKAATTRARGRDLRASNNRSFRAGLAATPHQAGAQRADHKSPAIDYNGQVRRLGSSHAPREAFRSLRKKNKIGGLELLYNLKIPQQ